MIIGLLGIDQGYVRFYNDKKIEPKNKEEVDSILKGIEAGDDVEIDFDSGVITNHTKGTSFQGQAFPEFMQKIIAAEGLINYINNK